MPRSFFMDRVDYSEFYYKTENKKVESLPQKAISPNEISYAPQKRSRSKGRGKAIAILAIILCFCLTLVLSDYFSGGYLLADFDQSAGASIDAEQYYALQTGMYSDLKTAEEYAKTVKSRGGAGYVYYDGVYRVIASIYKTAVQARTVGEKMGQSGIDATVFSFSISPYTDSSISQSDRNELELLSDYTDYCYQTLYTLSNDIDTGNLSQGVSVTLNGLVNYLENSNQKAQNISFSTPALSLSSNIKGAIEIIKNVPQTPVSSDLRYAYCAILMSRI